MAYAKKEFDATQVLGQFKSKNTHEWVFTSKVLDVKEIGSETILNCVTEFNSKTIKYGYIFDHALVDGIYMTSIVDSRIYAFYFDSTNEDDKHIVKLAKDFYRKLGFAKLNNKKEEKKTATFEEDKTKRQELIADVTNAVVDALMKGGLIK